MRSQPKHYFTGDLMVHHFPTGDILIESTIVDPPSSEGRSVNLHVLAEDVPALLKELRTAAISIRNTPMDATRDA